MKLRKTIWALARRSGVLRLPRPSRKIKSRTRRPSIPMLRSNPGFDRERRICRKPPVGAARGVSDATDAQPYDPSQVMPDHEYACGSRNLSRWDPGARHNIFDPSIIHFTDLGQTLPATDRADES